MSEIDKYIKTLESSHQDICKKLSTIIKQNLNSTDSKIWHGHPVWFIDGNPIVGFSPRADGTINLMFWSGQSFEEPNLKPEGSFKAAEIRYKSVDDINEENLLRWLKKSQIIQWDYKNLVKRKGKLEKLL